MYSAALLALAATASAAVKGFNYGNTFTTGAIKQQSDYETEFTTAQNLVGAQDFTSARLYTMVQGGSTNDPIAAIPAAIKTKTSLLLGLWASGTSFPNELAALTRAIDQYGDDLASLVDGISVGSEDLYRNSPQGIAAGSNIGAEPATIIDYISQVRKALQGTKLSGAKIGHVDTWTAWVNGSNSAVADACDWIGVDAYPYFQDTMVNAIADGSSLFDDAFGQTQNAVGGKPVWVTETGWPVSGKTSGQAEPSTDNAKAYWDAVGCNTLFGKTNTWWYVLQDAAPDTPNPSFGLVGSTLSTTPLYDLSCSNVTSSSSSSASASASATTTLATVSSSSGASQATSTGSSDTGGSPGISTGSGGGSSGPNQSASPSGSSSGSGSGSGSGSNSSSGSGSGSSGSSGTGSSGSGSNSTTTGSSSTATHTSPPITGAATVQSVGSVLFAAVMAVLAL